MTPQFTSTCVINLRSRKDRKASMIEQFRVMGLPAPEFLTVDPPAECPATWPLGLGAWGCLQSHLTLLERARDAAGPSLILEDDCRFAPDALARITAFMDAIPGDWHLCFIGGRHTCIPKKASPDCWIARRVVMTHGYGVTPQGAARILQCAAALFAAKPAANLVDAFAHGMNLGAWNSYCVPSPWPVVQMAGPSDILGTFRPER